MSILTKEHRASMREFLDTKSASDDDAFISIWALSEILDTIDALEAERDALKTDLHLWKKTSSSLHAQQNWMAGMIGRIKTIATASHDTRVIDTRIIDGTHAALREILAVIEGADREGER